MTYDYAILPEKECIVQRFTGSVTLQDVIACTERLWADPRYDKAYRTLSDLRQATFDASPRDVFAFVAFLKRPECSHARCAAILSEPRSTALVMMFKMVPNPWLEIFSTWEAASESLDVEIPASVFAEAASRP